MNQSDTPSSAHDEPLFQTGPTVSPLPEFSVVAPVYNSAATIHEFCSRVARVFDTLIQSSFEIVLVDDGSRDSSWDTMCDARRLDTRIRVLQLARNFGQHPALLCGLAHARGDFVITMDDDLQHPPEEIPKLIDALRENPKADVIIGAYETKQHSAFRNLGTWIINRATSHVFRKDPGLKLTSFRILRKRVVVQLLQFHVESPRVGQLLLMATSRIRNVPVRHDPRKQGRSGYTLSRLVKDFLDNILGSSTIPLRFVGYVGFASSAASFVLLALYMVRYFIRGISVPGWTTIILLLLFFFGVLFLTLGLIGEYLIRILREARKVPIYVVREIME